MNIENVLQEQNNSTDVQFLKYIISMVHDHVYNSEYLNVNLLHKTCSKVIIVLYKKKNRKSNTLYYAHE